jgi:acetyltransferase-like isoleucine patch superfamily enzyme
MPDQVTRAALAPGEAVDAAQLARLGLLRAGEGCVISPLAVFIAADSEGAARPVELGDSCRVGAFAVICGGTRIGAGVVIRAGAVIYAGAEIGEETVIGHHTLLRSFVTVGGGTQLGHNLTIERATRIGRLVRCSPGSHITSSCVLADRVFLGAGVRTVNDKEMTWRDPGGREPELVPPVFGAGARVGSGSVVLAGISIGEHALVGAGSVVTRDIPAGAVAFGNPARVRGTAERAAS